MSDPNAGSKPGFPFRKAHGENAQKRNRELWSKRPFSYGPHCSWVKRMCRRVERRVLEKLDIRKRMEDLGDE